MVICPFLLAAAILIARETRSFIRERREQQRGFPLDFTPHVSEKDSS